jgi:pyruvate dehydrogenase E2 component (dihydrolipoamide acetyltransferase)
MPVELKLPDLGEGIHEGEIVEVLVAVGDRVKDGQPVLVVETDKATAEVPAPVDGVVHEIRVKAGDVVKVGQVLMTFTAEGERQRGEAEKRRQTAAGAETAGVERGVAVRQVAAPAAVEAGPARGSVVAAAPSTRRLARQLGVDLEAVPASGPGGRVTAEDVRAFAGEPRRSAAAPEAPIEGTAAELPVPSKTPALPDFAQWGEIERVPLRSVRRATARRMSLAWAEIPHVTHEDEADITELDRLRQRHKAEVETRGGVLSLTVFALKAAVAALKAFPRFNATLDTDTDEMVVKRYYHIGVAVDTDRGLVVPVVRDVDRKSLTQLAIELAALVRKTREGKIEREAVVGGTFTITNIGILGGTGFTPIINYPQAAILGLAQARLQPVVRGSLDNYQVVPRLMLPLVLGFDHRINDGADAARFLALVIRVLEDPEQMLLEV